VATVVTEHTVAENEAQWILKLLNINITGTLEPFFTFDPVCMGFTSHKSYLQKKVNKTRAGTILYNQIIVTVCSYVQVCLHT